VLTQELLWVTRLRVFLHAAVELKQTRVITRQYTIGLIAGPLPDIIYRSEKRQRRRPGQWVRIRRSGGYRRKLPVDWEREFVADRAQLLDVHGEYATGGGRDWLTRDSFTKGTWAEKVADHIEWRDGGPEVRAALQAKHEAAIAHGKMLADRVMGRAPPDDKRYQADDVGGNETLIALADRLRALSMQNDPDAVRAGRAQIADALNTLYCAIVPEPTVNTDRKRW
jgi:hypothetical protein